MQASVRDCANGGSLEQVLSELIIQNISDISWDYILRLQSHFNTRNLKTIILKKMK